MVRDEVTIAVKVEGEADARRALRRIHREAAGGIDVAWLSALVFLASLLGATVARAEDAHGVVGTRHGCVDFSVTSTGTTYTSASLENMQGSAALAASLYWTEIMVKGGSDPVYLCEAAVASCGADTTNKLVVATGASITLPTRGISVQSIALFGPGLGATTGQLCGFFRVTP